LCARIGRSGARLSRRRPNERRYHRGTVIGKRTWPAVLGLAVLGSQAGHLLAYQLRFGSAAQQVQSSGAHAYFPLLVKTSLGVVAVALLAGLFVIGLARVLAGRQATQTGRPSYLSLLAVMFTVQLACFVGQEVGEALLAGSAVDSAPHLILWGTLGQLPVAVLGAIAIGWIARRYESAVNDLRQVLSARPPSPAMLCAASVLWVTVGRALLLSQVAGASLAKRGPPLSSRVSSS
jgi:hypothetical protein